MRKFITVTLLFISHFLFSQSSLTEKLSQYLLKGEQVRKNIRLDSTGLSVRTARKEYHFSLDSLQKLLAYHELKAQRQKIKWSVLQLRNRFLGLPKFTGLRVAIDPGHFAGELATAQIEGKYLQMLLPDSTQIEFYESALAWATARILADSLKKNGAKVLLTRSAYNLTAFEKTFQESYASYAIQCISKKTKPLTAQAFFRRYFLREELEERARKINAFEPDLTIIIHYNVDENNKPWKQPTPQNFCMAFVAGGLEAEQVQTEEDIEILLRLLCSSDVERSIQLSDRILQAHQTYARVPIIPAENNQNFLHVQCLWTGIKGIYARNLLLCRKVKGILCYGESLFQDSEQELHRLNDKSLQINGLCVSSRILEIAQAYWHGICSFLW